MRRTLKICSSCDDLQQVVPEAFDFRLVTEQFERYIYRYFAGYPPLAGFNLEEESAPTANKYARRGDIVFVGGGALLVIALWIFGGLAYFDAFHTSSPKPVAEKPTPPPVVQKP